jgi:hypothetical protein
MVNSMSDEHIFRMLRNRFGVDRQVAEGEPSGFMANPFGSSISAAQAQLYQAALLQAQRDLQLSEWPLAEYWN